MINDFKHFILRGNVLDLAVGVIIGAAFGKIIDSLVGDIFMPLVGAVTGGVDFSARAIDLGPTIHLAYGNLLTALLNFLLIAGATYFFIVRPVSRLMPPPPPAGPSEAELLTEIRDLLKARD
jgi:large conductance mechanosensitive channel